MAHADYACCAVCDRKLYYSDPAPTKEEICQECTAALVEMGVPAATMQEFMKWLQSEALNRVVSALTLVGFHFCYYSNPVDQTLFARLKEAGLVAGDKFPYGKTLVSVLEEITEEKYQQAKRSEFELQRKIERWRDLMLEARRLEEEIKAEVLKLGKTVKVSGARATFGRGRTRYDWEAIAKALEPDDELIRKYSRVQVDWRKVALELTPSEDLKQRFAIPGEPYVTLKLEV